MPVGGKCSPRHDGHLVSYSDTGALDSFQLSTSALCSKGSQKILNIRTEIPQKNSNEIESPTAIGASRSDRYKTELCRQFGESGSCRYGDKCQFAHGAAELRVVERHPKYKTNLCRTFHSTGFCPYGARCHFIHGEAAASNSTAVNSGLKRMRWTAMKQNSHPLDAIGISADRGISVNDVERLISGIQGLMDHSVKAPSSLRLIQENVAPVLPSSQRQFQCLSRDFLSSSIEGFPPAFYLTDLMGSTSVTPSLSCSSDSPTLSPTPTLSDFDIWKSFVSVIGVGV